MAKYQVRTPDGKEYEIDAPDAMNEKDVLAQFETQLKQPQQAQQDKPLTEREKYIGQTASIADMGLGIGDEFLAGVGSVFDPSGGDYSKQLGEIRSSQKRYAEKDPVGYLGRTLIGGAPLALATGGAAMAGAARLAPAAGRVGQAMIVGGGYGGAAGYGAGEGGVLNRAQSAGFGVGIGAATGGVLEGVVSPVLSRFIQAVRGRPALLAPDGTLTPQGEQAARAAGINIDEASAALNREFGEQAQRAVNPAHAAAAAEARTLPVPINLRQGQVDLNPDQQMFESQAAKDVFGGAGNRAGVLIRNSMDEQQAGLRANTEAIQARIGGGQVQETGQGVGAARQSLLNSFQATRARVGQLYQAARDANGNAFVLGRNVSDGLAGIRQGLNDAGLTDRTAGRVHGIIGRAANDLLDTAQAVGREPNISVGNMFAIRQELSALSRSSDAVEAGAARQARQGVDRWLNTAIDEDLITGDPAVVELWRRAISARRDQAVRFQAGDLVEKLVEQGPGPDGLKLDPIGAANLIFGRSKTGFVTQGGMLRGLENLRTQLGPTSREWHALREEAFLRFARGGEGATQPLGRDFSGANFAKEWETALRDSPAVMRTLFSNEERNLISQFSRVARRVTTNVRGGANASNTSAGVANLMRRMFLSSFAGPRLAAFLDNTPMLRSISNIGNELRANAAVAARVQQGPEPLRPLAENLSPALSRLLPAVTPAAAGYAGQRINRE